MFTKDRYITRGVANNISLELQLILWSIVDNHVRNQSMVDYLQVIELSEKVNGNRKQQLIVHRQEEPKYKKEYIKELDQILTEKVFVIDQEEYSVMMLAEEY